MTMQRRAVVLRLLAEFFVIMVGVLAALATDRWMQSEDAQATAVSYHGRLVAELEADSIRLERLRSAASARADSARVLLYSLQRMERRGALQLYYAATAYGTLPTSDATFQEMQSTGALQLFPADLRRSLFDYYAEAARMRGMIDEARRMFVDPLRHAAGVSGLYLPDGRPTSEEDEAFHERLGQFPGIEGIVTGAVAYQAGGLGALIVGQWRPRLAETLALVRASTPR